MVNSSKSKEQRNKEKVLAAARKGNKERDWFTIIVSSLVVLVILGIGAFIVAQNNKETKESTVAASTTSPPNVINDGFTVAKDGLVVAEAYKNTTEFTQSEYTSELTDISMYVDYACPHCADFEEANIGQMEQWLMDGEVDTLTIHPLAFLSDYSLNATNTLSCVAEYSPTNVLATHKALMAAQSSAPDGKELVALASSVGVPVNDEFSKCVRGGKYVSFVDAATNRAQSGPVPATSLDEKEGITGTPTIFVNGEKYPGDPSPETFASFVSSVKAGSAISEEPTIEENQTEVG